LSIAVALAGIVDNTRAAGNAPVLIHVLEALVIIGLARAKSGHAREQRRYYERAARP
jgi:hypothetical protein